ncbi:ABC transporter permease [Breznakiella homolactica]|uniref:ABC transporter permease n=2 Tax=Breznakiella homolactica TaxID=2798577 RepID=A0A7T8BCB3_9SPIR|nr:ABC transporter permease [Breznakiella homolactica]
MAADPEIRKHSNFAALMGRLRKNNAAMLGLIIFLVLVLIAVFSPLIMPYPYDHMDLINAYSPPSAEHWFGTDDLGRDVLSRIMYGGRYSLSIGIIATGFSVLIGMAIGAVAGYFGGRVDNLIMRFMDIIQAVPGLLLTIAISAVLGSGFDKTIMALGLSNIPNYVRIVRASIMSIRKMEYLEAAESINCRNSRIILHHALPNALSPVIVQATMGVANTVLTAASLSFIGLGVQPPTPEWGAMLSAGRNFIRDYPHMVIFPGVFIMISVLALNMLGDGLRDALDPKLKN